VFPCYEASFSAARELGERCMVHGLEIGLISPIRPLASHGLLLLLRRWRPIRDACGGRCLAGISETEARSLGGAVAVAKAVGWMRLARSDDDDDVNRYGCCYSRAIRWYVVLLRRHGMKRVPSTWLPSKNVFTVWLAGCRYQDGV